MGTVSRMPHKMPWQERAKRASLLDVMALRKTRVAAELRRLQELHGLTQAQAADKVGVDTRTWQRWTDEDGTIPYPRNLATIAERFGVSLDVFVDDASAPQPAMAQPQLDRIEAKLDDLIRMLVEADLARAPASTDAPRKPRTARSAA